MAFLPQKHHDRMEDKQEQEYKQQLQMKLLVK